MEIIDTMVKAGYEVNAYPTQARGDAIEKVKNEAGEYDLVVCSGGDGTLDEAVTGMMSREEKRPLGYIPAGSTNDFANSVPIGEFFTESVEAIPTLYDENGNFARSELRKKRSFIFDKNTFCGRLNIIFEKLKKDYPFADIIIMTPLHRAYAYFGGDNIQPDELYANGAGRYFDEYVQTVRKCADVWSLKLIDLYRESGLYPLGDGNAALYFCSDKTDRLHPNANGHARIAETIMQSVKLD